MTAALRVAALLIAIAAIVDPVWLRRQGAPLPVDVYLPPPSAPEHVEASRAASGLLTLLGDAVSVGRGERPRAIVAITGHGSTPLNTDSTRFNTDIEAGATVFGVRLPQAGVIATSAPALHTLLGRRPVVSAEFRARQMRGRTTTFKLTNRGATLGAVEHKWPGDAAVFAPAFHYVPPSAGVSVVRIVADTAGMAPAAVDLPVITADRKVRVFVYEPRPSWAAAFARQALEADPLFAVTALARTSRGIVTQTAGAPASLHLLDADSVDAIMVGALDALTPADLGFLQRFAAERGGSVVLVPDGAVPDRVRAALDVPMMREVLLERPSDVRFGGLSVRASEFLAVGDRANRDDAVISIDRGEGRVLVVGALDAWRYRAHAADAFALAWRAAIADAAAQAVPRIAVGIDPVLARPGDEVTVRVKVRQSEWVSDSGEVRLPDASASVIGSDGSAEPVRLWPGSSAGEYLGRFVAAAAGAYDVRVDAGRHVRDAVLAVRDEASLPAQDDSRQIDFLAETTGGAVVAADDLSRLAEKIRATDRPLVEQRVRVMRSPWWVLPFALLLGAEWAIRRRRGLR